LDESKDAVGGAMKVRKMPGIVVWEEPGEEKSLAVKYNVHMLPTWFLLDREGVIRARDPEPDKLESLIRPLLTTGDSAESKSPDSKKPEQP